MKPKTMIIMRKILLAIATLLLFSFSNAQSSEKSKSILDQANQHFEKSEGIKLVFTMNTIDEDGTNYEPQPITAFVKGNKFKLNLSNATTWFDGKTQWVLLNDANEVNISTPSADELSIISPLALLNMYKSGYILKEPVNKTINGQEVVEIEMTPTDKSQDLKTISIAINKKTNIVAEVKFTLKNGLRNKLTISEFNINEKYSDDLFTFNRLNHPRVEVIDLR